MSRGHDPRCRRCGLAEPLCVCAEVRPQATRTEIVIVRHAQERAKSSNTGRLAALALRRATLFDHGLPDAPLDADSLARPGTWLLFPEGPARAAPPSPPPERLIVLDGTWPQARRMRQRIAALHGLPVLNLAPGVNRPRMRRSPRAGHMATIEAIAAALQLLGDPDAASALLDLYDLVVDRTASSRHASAALARERASE